MKLQSLNSLIQDQYFHSGTKIPQLHLKSLKKFKANIPSLFEQKKIIDIIEPLDCSLSSLKTLRRTIYKPLEHYYFIHPDEESFKIENFTMFQSRS